MKTFRVGQSLHSGKFLVDSPGFGVLGASIPTDGYLYPYLSLPADNDAEMRGEILSWPAAGELTVYNDTTWSFTGPDGSYEFTFQGYRDNVPFGPVRTVAFTVGEATDIYEYTGSGGVVVGGAAGVGWVPEGPRTYAYAGSGGLVVGGAALASPGSIGGSGGGSRSGGGVTETLVERLLRENMRKQEPIRTVVIRAYHSAGGGARVGGAAKTRFTGKPQTRTAESTGGVAVGGSAVAQFKPRLDPAVRRARRNTVLIMAAAARRR